MAEWKQTGYTYPWKGRHEKHSIQLTEDGGTIDLLSDDEGWYYTGCWVQTDYLFRGTLEEVKLAALRHTRERALAVVAAIDRELEQRQREREAR